MTYFNSRSYKINISANQVELYLQKITTPHKSTKNRHLLFRGRINQNQFNIKSPFHSEIMVIDGKVEAADKDHSYIHLSGRFLWPHLLLNVFTLVVTTITLSLLAYLLFAENKWFGTFAISATLFICWQLYRNLIGRIKKTYDKMSNEIIDLLACKHPYSPIERK